MSEPERLPVARPEEVLGRLRAHRAAEASLRDYLLGVLDGMGVDRARLVGVDDETGAILLEPEPPE